MLDYIFKDRTFVIRLTETQEVCCTIDSHLIDLSSAGEAGGGRRGVTLYASRIHFVSEEMIVIINEHQLECYFKLTPSRDGKVLTMELKSAASVDNMKSNFVEHDGPHLGLDPKVLKESNTFERLIRCNNRYKTRLTHAKNFRQADFKLLAQIFTVDYSQPWTKATHFDSERTFTLLDWRIADKILNDETFDLENIND